QSERAHPGLGANARGSLSPRERLKLAHDLAAVDPPEDHLSVRPARRDRDRLSVHDQKQIARLLFEPDEILARVELEELCRSAELMEGLAGNAREHIRTSKPLYLLRNLHAAFVSARLARRKWGARSLDRAFVVASSEAHERHGVDLLLRRLPVGGASF